MAFSEGTISTLTSEPSVDTLKHLRLDSSVMRLGFVVFDGLTALDFVGMYDPLTRLGTMDILDDISWEICARQPQVTATGGLTMRVDAIDEPLDDYDILLVPGGSGNRPLLADHAYIEWLRTAAAVPLKASVCTGSLLYGAAGFLDGHRATTHPGSYDRLGTYCDDVVRERIVDDGDIVTAGGVASSIDLGLHLIERLTDMDTRNRIATQMDYPYKPSN